jgi:hypothetical protein
MIVGSGIPSGLPAGNRLHDLARRSTVSDPRVLYVENNPMVVAMAQATIEPFTDLVRVVEGDAREIDDVLRDHVVQTFLDWDRPMAVLLLSAYSLDDDEHAHYVIKRLRHTAPADSFLGLLHTTFDGIPPELLPAIRDMLAMAAAPRDPFPRGGGGPAGGARPGGARSGVGARVAPWRRRPRLPRRSQLVRQLRRRGPHPLSSRGPHPSSRGPHPTSRGPHPPRIRPFRRESSPHAFTRAKVNDYRGIGSAPKSREM